MRERGGDRLPGRLVGYQGYLPDRCHACRRGFEG
jgi:hypothetical protein